MERKELFETLKACGWAEDAYGHLQCARVVKDRRTGESRVRQYRVKFQDISCRIEVKHEGPPAQWIRIGGAYYSAVMRSEGGVRVGSYTFTPVAAHAA